MAARTDPEHAGDQMELQGNAGNPVPMQGHIAGWQGLSVRGGVAIRSTGPVSVDDIKAKNQRDLETRLLHRDALQFIGTFCPAHVERRTQQPFANHLDVFGPELAIRFTIEECCAAMSPAA